MLALPALTARPEPQASDAVTYQARVVEVYADKAIVEINGQRFLVEPVISGQAFPADIGAEIQVVGQQRANVIIPTRIVLPSGAVVSSPSDAGEAGNSAPSEADRSHRGPARRSWHHGDRPSLPPAQSDDRPRPHQRRSRRDRLVRSQPAPRGNRRGRTSAHSLNSRESLPEAEIAKLLAKQGYSSIVLLDQTRFRFLYSVSGPKGERMELHVDRGGNILRRVWLR